VTSFAEPREITPATWHWFALSDEQPRSLFAFAGIWRHWSGPIRKGGPDVAIDVFSFMTTLPNDLVATINHERMPVILATADEQDAWIDGDSDEAFRLARPYPAAGLRIVQGGFEKQDLLQTPPASE
jgi:putative SOS response-associated peptidase YedK